MAPAPVALLLDDGDLGGVRRALEQLGVEILLESGTPTLETLCKPHTLLVTSLRQSLALPPHERPPQRRIWICVHDVDLMPVRERLRRLGVDYLVRSNVEPEALRLLLAQILSTAREVLEPPEVDEPEPEEIFGETVEPEESPPVEQPAADRRRHPRAAYRHRVTALGLIQSAAAEVVLGRDLSVSGMRIDKHPHLLVGCQTTLAIHTGGREEPILVRGAIVHDEGGLGVEFQEVTHEQRRRLERLIQQLPPLEELCQPKGSSDVVVTRVVELD
jgi:hypothetical protein